MVDWSQAVIDPSRSFKQGNDYVNSLYDQAAKLDAGKKYAAGDIRGALSALAGRGDLKGAQELNSQAVNADAGQLYAAGDMTGAAGALAKGGNITGAAAVTTAAQTEADKKAATFQKQHDYLQRAVPVLTGILQKGGPQAVQQAFEQLVPELQGIGTPPEQIDKLKQSFASNPEQTLQVLGATAAKKYTFQKVGEDIAVFDENNPGAGPITTFKGDKAAPAGYENGPNNTLVPLKGGPADPEVKKQDALNRRQVIVNNPTVQPGGEDVALTDEDANFLAEQLIAGDTTVLQNLGRGAQGAKNVIKLRHAAVDLAKSRGMDGKAAAAAVAEFTGLKAGERTLGTRGAAINLAADEADTFAKQALDASAQVPRGNFVPMNRLLQYSEGQISDPKLKKLFVATQALINARARAISPTGIPRLEDQQEGRKLLAAADGPEAYNAAVQQMMLEVQTAKSAPKNVREQMNSDFTGNAPAQASVPPKVIDFKDLP